MLIITTTTIVWWGVLAYAGVRWNTWVQPEIPQEQGALSNPEYYSPSKDIPIGITNLLDSHPSNKTKEAFQQASNWTRDAVQRVGNKTVDKFEQASNWTRDTFKQVGNWTRDAAYNLTDWTEQRLDKGKQKANDWWDRLSHPSLHLQRQYLFNQHQQSNAWSSSSASPTTLYQMRVLPHEYVLFLDVAGLPPSSLHLQVARGQLLLHGHHEECVGRACWERQMEEVLELPDDVQVDSIESYLHLQVLIVRLPRRRPEPEREIKIMAKGGGPFEKLLERVGWD